MPSGGARARSGPPPDPNALRRNRKDDAGWETLPAGGFDGSVPEFPLAKKLVYDVYYVDKQRFKELDTDSTEAQYEREVALWERLWRKPQGAMWAKLGLEYEVAAYVRGFLESTSEESNSGLKTAVLRMAAEIGLSLPGMHSLRWKFSEDEIGARRDEHDAAPTVRKSARDRLKVINS